jgi:DNA repair protein RAD16
VTILDNRPKLQHSLPGAKHPPGTDDLEVRIQEEAMWQAAAHEWRHEMVMNNVSRKAWPKGRAAAARAGTLVVCPVIALSQWKSEIEKFTEPGSLSVGVYHGPDREKQMPRELLAKYDVVLTTYQVLEQDFRKMVSPNKVACPNCGAKFKIDKLRVHLKYFCGEGARRTEAQMRQRRTADRPGRRRSSSDRKDGGNKDGKKQSPPTKTKKPLQATKAKKWSPPVPEAKPKPSKSRLKIQCVEDYDSERELSAEETSGLEIPSSRPIRSAAMNASRRVSASYREWNAASSTKGGIRAYDDEENDDDYKYSSDESRASESDDSVNLRNSVSSKKPPVKLWARGRKQAAARPSSVAKRKHSEINDDDEESDNDDDDEETMALDRARAKQQAALDVARRSKKGTISSKAKGGTKKISPSNLKATGKARKKKFDDESSSTESSDSGDDIDPLAGVDIDELMEEAMVGAKFSVLHGFTWWRCVLDEAHFIKSRSSQTAASAFALTCVHRWCLSGTPLQNRVGELYSLIRFVRLDPMSHYFCRQCSCKSIHYRMQQGVCQDCGHRAFSHFSHFNKHVLNPIQRDGYTGDGRRAMFILKNDVLDKCLLRRTKENRAEDMNLPPRLVTIRPVRLHPVEEDFYNALYTQTKSSFDDYVAEGTLLNNYAHIFVRSLVLATVPARSCFCISFGNLCLTFEMS